MIMMGIATASAIADLVPCCSQAISRVILNRLFPANMSGLEHLKLRILRTRLMNGNGNFALSSPSTPLANAYRNEFFFLKLAIMPTLAFTSKTETLGSSYSHVLLILTKSSESTNQVVHELKFKIS